MSLPNNRKIAKPRSKQSAHSSWTVSGQDPLSGDEAPPPEPLSYEERKRRDQATRILNNHELLMWMSEQRNESILQTRMYYLARSAGLRENDVRCDYKWDNTEIESSHGKGKSPATKGKVRVVSGASSSKDTGSPASNRREKARRSTGSAR